MPRSTHTNPTGGFRLRVIDVRRAEYLRGAGRLSVGAGRLLFVRDGEQSDVEDLERAASSDRPGRDLATVVALRGFDVPAFVFAQVGDRLQGIVYGAVQLQINDGGLTTVDGAAADPWAHFDASTSSTLVCGDGGFHGAPWVELGVVYADGFRWFGHDDEAAALDHPMSSDTTTPSEVGEAAPTDLEAVLSTAAALAGSSMRDENEGDNAASAVLASESRRPDRGSSTTGSGEQHAEADGDHSLETSDEQYAEAGSGSVLDSAPDSGDQAPLPSIDGSSLLDDLHSEFEATIDAIRFAEIRSDKGDQQPGMSKSREGRARPEPTVAAPAVEAARDTGDEGVITHSDAGIADRDATIDLGPGQVLLDGLHSERRTVGALVCLECENPNPPATIRCRYCTALLSSTNTEVREVPQPVLGVIRLSGGREVLLDTDLLIGRNPGYLPLDRYQRAVEHAEQDRTVSRRHIELKLDQWKVMAINLKNGSNATLESRDGRRTRLLVGIPQQLRSGDTVYYGGAWLRFEPEE